MWQTNKKKRADIVERKEQKITVSNSKGKMCTATEINNYQLSRPYMKGKVKHKERRPKSLGCIWYYFLQISPGLIHKSFLGKTFCIIKVHDSFKILSAYQEYQCLK